MNNRSGFTLVEVIVVLAVLAILTAIAVPVTLRIFETAAEDATREEMLNLKKAMIGDPRKLQSTFRSDFGFLGDIGRLPSTLDDLYTQGSLPGFSFDSAKQAGAGWKGPYITGGFSGEEAEDFKKDGLGNDYTFTVGASTLDGTLVSNGPDGAFGTSDDITVAILPNETTATIRGSVKDTAGNGLAGVSVDLNFASNGSLSTVTATTDSNGNYAFLSAPFGPRSVQPNATLVLVPGSITTSGGANNNVNFQMTNYSSSAVTVTIVNVTCPAGVTDYARIRFDGRNVDPGGEELCGADTPVSGSNTAFSANPTPPAPLRVVVDSPDSQLPDLTIRGGGATRTIQLRDFENGNSNVDMRNKTLTVTFTFAGGGTATTTFTP